MAKPQATPAVSMRTDATEEEHEELLFFFKKNDTLPIELIPTRSESTLADKTTRHYRIEGRKWLRESTSLSYEAIDTKDNKRVFIKLPRIPKDVSVTELQRRLSTIYHSYTSEFIHRSTLEELKRKNNGHASAPVTLEVGVFKRLHGRDETEVIVPYIVQEYIEGDTLEHIVSQFESADGQEPRSPTHDVWFTWAQKIVDVLRKLHNNHIVHGDIQPRKFLFNTKPVDETQATLVDFAYSVPSPYASSGEDDRYKNNTYAAPECRFDRTKPDATSDIYSIGGVLFFLATGQKPPDIEQYIAQFASRRKWNQLDADDTEGWKTKIHERFKDAVSPKILSDGYESIVKIIDKCMRPRPDDRYPSVERLRIALDSIRTKMEDPPDISASLNKIRRDWTKLSNEKFTKKGATKLKRLHPPFERIVESKLGLLTKELQDMLKEHYELVGEREDLIDNLVKYLTFLHAGDEYITITVPQYWSRDNLGINGRFLTINKDLVRRGVHVRRLFLTCPEDYLINHQTKEPAESLKILLAHRQALRDLPVNLHSPDWQTPAMRQVQAPKEAVQIHDPELKNKGTIWVGCWNLLNRSEVDEFLKFNVHVAIWKKRSTHSTPGAKKSKREDDMIAITFTSRKLFERDGTDAGRSEIVKVRFKRIADHAEYEQMLKYIKKGVPIEESISLYSDFKQ